MFVDLTAGIDNKNVDHSSIGIYGKKDSPTPPTRDLLIPGLPVRGAEIRGSNGSTDR